MEGISKRGSSPHTRGTRPRAPRLWHYRWDHPRIRGEHPPSFSPARLVSRIIPAYAGNTQADSVVKGVSAGSSPHTRGTPWCPSWFLSLVGDHPRIRGEHIVAGAAAAFAGGDHPRIRGEHGKLRERAHALIGIIPAYAGNTDVIISGASLLPGSSPHTRGTRGDNISKRIFRRDHPRIRGEHTIPAAYVFAVRGIIPAYAGNTTPVSGEA